MKKFALNYSCKKRSQFMKTYFNITGVYLIIYFALLMISCSQETNQIAGGTNIPNQITGRIFLPDSTPLVNGQVTLYKNSTLSPNIISYDSTRTDSSGFYAFDSIAEGNYVIEAKSDDLSFMTLIDNIIINVNSGAVIMQPEIADSTGSLEGLVRFTAPVSLRAILIGTPYFSPVLQDGSYRFEKIPAQSYVLAIVNAPTDSLVSSQTIFWSDSVHIVSGTITKAEDATYIPKIQSITDSFVFANFEDSTSRNAFQNWWWWFDSKNDDGDGFVYLFDQQNRWIDWPGANGTRFALHYKFNLGTHPLFHSGIGSHLIEYNSKYTNVTDFTTISKISFYVKGIGNAGLYVTFQSNYVNHSPTLFKMDTIPNTWTQYEIDLTKLGVPPDTINQPWSVTGKYVSRFVFVNYGPSRTNGELWLDEIVFK